MDSRRLTAWIQILTSIAVLLGLILVVWELQQARNIAQAQLISDNYGVAAQIHTSLFGENASEVLAKSCSSPEDLTEGELQILMRVHLAYLNLALRNYYIDTSTNVTQDSWQDEARRNITGILACEPGRAMWEIFNPQLPIRVQELGREILQKSQENIGIAELLKRGANRGENY